MSAATTLFVVLLIAGVGAIAGLRRLMFGPFEWPRARSEGDVSITAGVDGIYHRGDGSGDVRDDSDGDGDGADGGGDGGGGDGGGGGRD